MTRAPEIAKAAEAASAHFNGPDGFPNAGKVNLYVCEGDPASPALPGLPSRPAKPGCGRFTVTVDREPGVTPFMIRCPFCKATATSNFYRVPQNWPADHEWYRPDQFEPDDSEWTREHVLKGGLMLRKIEPEAGPTWTAYRDSIIQAALEARDRLEGRKG